MLFLVHFSSAVALGVFYISNSTFEAGHDFTAAAQTGTDALFAGGSKNSLLWSATSDLFDNVYKYAVDTTDHTYDYTVKVSTSATALSDLFLTQSFQATALPVATYGLASTSNGTHALFGGGGTGDSFNDYSYSDQLIAYQSSSRAQSYTLSQARGFATATTILSNGLAMTLIAGGNDNEQFYTNVDILDHTTDTLRRADLTVARKDAAAGSGVKASVLRL
jgi:hypothetical protein